MIDERVVQIVDAAVEGNGLDIAHIEYLLSFDPYSVEAAYACARAREIGLKACDGRGFIYGQIGVDQTACPENCRFCSFAAVNTDMDTYDPLSVEVPVGRIVHFAKLFDDAGVHLVSLMATAGLDFDRYLDMVRAVRASVSDELTIMANVGDLSIEQAHALKEAGVNAAYHALRLGEGQLTDIEPAMRKRTFRHLRVAGVPLMTGIEPLWRNIDPHQVALRMRDVIELRPFCIGACSLTLVEGADVGGRLPAYTGFVRYVAALLRLACGLSSPIGGIGGVAWVDAGCDPRNRGYGDDDATLRKKVADAKKRLSLEGFIVD